MGRELDFASVHGVLITCVSNWLWSHKWVSSGFIGISRWQTWFYTCVPLFHHSLSFSLSLSLFIYLEAEYEARYGVVKRLESLSQALFLPWTERLRTSCSSRNARCSQDCLRHCNQSILWFTRLDIPITYFRECRWESVHPSGYTNKLTGRYASQATRDSSSWTEKPNRRKIIFVWDE